MEHVKCDHIREQVKAFKDAFFPIHFTVQCLEVLEKIYLKSEMSHRGEGGRKVSKKCHVLIEWTLKQLITLTSDYIKKAFTVFKFLF